MLVLLAFMMIKLASRYLHLKQDPRKFPYSGLMGKSV